MPDNLNAGLYENVVTQALLSQLADVDEKLIERERLRSAEASDRIAQHLAAQIKRALDSVPDSDRVATGLEVARLLLNELDGHVARADVTVEAPVPPGELLSAIGEWQPDGTVRTPGRPLIPLLDTTLLTNAPGEPRVGHQIHAEIESADSIDLVMAFVRKSGLLPMVDRLREHCLRGKRLRVLTTTYTGSTEASALDLLVGLGAEVRVSYDISTTRLHAKAWIFHRHTAFSTAYVGSSNLTHSAQVAGMEWNVRVSAARNPDVLNKIEGVFEAYWQSVDFTPYVRADFDMAMNRPKSSADAGFVLSPVEIRLEPFQERLLEEIEISRQGGNHRNLLVSATGTGKTVMAAVFYQRLQSTMPRARLLFVAHRREILDQARATFRHASRDYSFGEKWVGDDRPTAFNHVFASVQSLRVGNLEHLEPSHFDVIIIDEFHHAAAQSYRRLMDDLRPKEMLGLTATPERADSLPILHWFGGRIAAELRLWDAVEQHRLAPFAYFGIHDGVDLTDVPWRRGQGYEPEALAKAYIGHDSWARLVFTQLADHVDDVATIRCLGFCISIDHAKYMAAQFQQLGMAAVAVWGTTGEEERTRVLRDLANGAIQVVFSVDLFNEGVDVPSVDTVLMLRPTDSATLFLQQLGRGLRLSPDKTVCTVLDFVGLHRREFRFDKRYRALLGGTRSDLERAVREGFPFLPAGCHMELDPVAQDVVLKSIKNAIPSTWGDKVGELRALGDISLAQYLEATGLELADIYSSNHTWSELRERAGLSVAPPGPDETALRKGAGRLRHVDDRQRLQHYQEILSGARPDVASMTVLERRLVRMLTATLADQVLSKDYPLQSAVDLVWAHPQVVTELAQLFHAIDDKPSHLHQPAQSSIPLQIHARYTRIEILAAVGEGSAAKTPQWREGVYDAKGVGADLLAFTLDKTSGEFSPTTRYQDYAISRDLIHWESQSTLRAASPTGLRYQNHVTMGRSIFLFARQRTDDRAFWFLGPATYVRHEGERPMAVTWRLHEPLSGDLFAAFAAAVA